MDTVEVLVLLGGIGLILFTLWFFFGAREGVQSVVKNGVQELTIVVKGGYSPDRIEVQAGRPVRLNFRREESNACTEQLIFSDYGISKMLPQGETVPVEFTPNQPGEFTFHCGMNMVRGRLIVRSQHE
jgi:plastocyanin domain-containing protein